MYESDKLSYIWFTEQMPHKGRKPRLYETIIVRIEPITAPNNADIIVDALTLYTSNSLQTCSMILIEVSMDNVSRGLQYSSKFTCFTKSLNSLLCIPLSSIS